jgi:hypothetical protein
MGPPVESSRLNKNSAQTSLIAVGIVGIAFALTLLRLVGFVSDNAVDLVFEDQWNFLEPLFKDQGPFAAFFYQHGPHREGLGGLINWYLYRWTEWDVRAEAWVGVGVIASAAVAAVALASRLRGWLSWTDAGFPLVLIQPLHWESLLFTTNLAHSILPLALLLGCANAWITRNPLLRGIGVVVFGVLILFTGYGLCGAVALAALFLFLLWRAESSRMRMQVAAGLAAFAVGAMIFAHGYHWDHATTDQHPAATAAGDYPRFACLMFASLLGFRRITVFTETVGAVLLVFTLLGFITAVRNLWWRQRAPAASAVSLLIGTVLVYLALTAYGRLRTNIEAAFLWRYTTLMTCAIVGLGLTVEFLWFEQKKRGRTYALAGWVAITLIIWCNFKPEQYAAAVANGKSHWIEAYLKTHDLAEANRLSYFDVYYPAPTSSLIRERLDWLETHRLSFFRDRPKDPASTEAPAGK